MKNDLFKMEHKCYCVSNCSYFITTLYYKQENHIKALKFYEEYIQLCPNDCDGYTAAGNTASEIDKELEYKFHKQAYFCCLENNSDKDILLGSLWNLALVCYELNKFSEAITYFNEIISLQPENLNSILDAYYFLINIYSKQSNHEKKLQNLFKGIALDKGFYIRYKWSIDLFSNIEKQQVYDHFKEKYDNNEVSIKIFNTLIYLSYELKKEDHFFEYIKLIEEQYPDHIDVTYWKIIIYINSNKFDQARNLYKAAINKETDFYEKHTWEETKYDPDKIKNILEGSKA